MSVYQTDRYKTLPPRAMLLHALKKVQLQERFTLVTQDSIGHLQTLCMSVLLPSGGIESELKRYSSPLSVENTKHSSVNPA